MSTEFKRENRYIVIKRSDLEMLPPNDRDLALTDLENVYSLMSVWGCPPRQFLVIESDWPEYEPTWAAIEARVTGKPALVATNDMREQFEHHVRKGIWGEDATTEKCLCLARQGDGYEDPGVNRDWLVWQASRQAVVVDLPEPEPFNVTAEESLEMDPEEYDYLESRHGAQYSTYRKCRAAIEAAGIKVKP